MRQLCCEPSLLPFRSSVARRCCEALAWAAVQSASLSSYKPVAPFNEALCCPGRQQARPTRPWGAAQASSCRDRGHGLDQNWQRQRRCQNSAPALAPAPVRLLSQAVPPPLVPWPPPRAGATSRARWHWCALGSGPCLLCAQSSWVQTLRRQHRCCRYLAAASPFRSYADGAATTVSSSSTLPSR